MSFTDFLEDRSILILVLIFTVRSSYGTVNLSLRLTFVAPIGISQTPTAKRAIDSGIEPRVIGPLQNSWLGLLLFGGGVSHYRRTLQ